MHRFVFLLVFVCATAGAQAPPPVAPPADAMKSVGFLVGDWKGTAWFQMGPGKRSEVRQTERVQSKVNGHVLLIEGVGFEGEGADARVVHDAIALLSWDAKAGKYKMDSRLANGLAGTYEASMDGDALVWGMETPQGKIRYTIRLDAEGRWHEVGEMSRDGSTWRQFMEMTLEKQKP